MTRTFFFVVLSLVAEAFGQATSPFNIDTTKFLYLSDTPSKGYVQLTFDNAVPDVLLENAVGSCVDSSLASGARLKTTDVKLTLIKSDNSRRVIPGTFTVVLTDCFTAKISLASVTPAQAPTADEKKFEVELAFTLQGSTVTIKQGGPAMATLPAIQQGVADAIGAYNKKAPAKTSNEKNIFAGLSVTVPSGGGSGQGTADIIVHKEFGQFDFLSGKVFDQVVAGLDLKKGSQPNADPKHFSTGFTFRKDLLLAGRKKFSDIKDALNRRDYGRATALAQSLPNRPFSALLFDAGTQFEGDIKGTSIGNISNLIFVAEPRLVSPVFGVPGTKSFVKFTIIPAAVEVGANLQNPDNPALDGHSVGRLKSGAVLNVLLDSASADTFGGHFELDLQAVNRYLWQEETAFNPTTKLASGTVDGNQYYAETSVKFFVGTTALGRPGFKLSFTRGTLPPAYAFTKVFNFGFIFESTDDQHKIK